MSEHLSPQPFSDDEPKPSPGMPKTADYLYAFRGTFDREPRGVCWVQGAWCEPADLDRLFRLRATRRLNAGGSVRFRHWRLYGERGLAGERVAVWVWDETVTIEYAAETLAQYPVTCEGDGRGLRDVGAPRLHSTGHASPQPFLPELAEVEWHPARRLAPYRPRRPRAAPPTQARLLETGHD